MQTFKLTLSDGNIVSGCLSFPESKGAAHLPLIVCLPGGSYDAGYFDVDVDHSISSIFSLVGVPVISLDRPGYGFSTTIPAESEETYAQTQGKYINSTILPCLWTEFGNRVGASAVVLLAHSIGAMTATISAGSHTVDSGYPLAGLITSGIGTELSPGPKGAMIRLLGDATDTITFDPPAKDGIMLQWPFRSVVEPRMVEYTERLNKPVPRGELLDINTTWLGYWRRYSDRVTVPLMYGLGEFDGLWVSTQDAVEDYKRSFPACPKVTGEIIPMAPHCIELSLQSKAWYLRCCGFAIECTVGRGLKTGLLDDDAGKGDDGPKGITTLVYTTTEY